MHDQVPTVPNGYDVTTMWEYPHHVMYSGLHVRLWIPSQCSPTPSTL